MQRRLIFAMILACLARARGAQPAAMGWQDTEDPPPFEVYGLASGMRTVDVTGTLIVHKPAPNQPLGFTPSGLASGARGGFVWRHDNVGLVTEIGFHKYADRTGSTTMAPLMVGLRVHSHEQFRTSFFGEGLAGAYRWTVNSGSMRFATGKLIISGGGGMDIRLTRRWVWRVFEIQIAIAGARNGPLLTGGPSTGIAYRFGSR
jgi:hypothetical protein